jgi:hypothetical protein
MEREQSKLKGAEVYRTLQMEKEETMCERKGECEAGKQPGRPISEITEEDAV